MNLWQGRNLVVFCLLGLALTLSAQAYPRYTVGTPIALPDINQPATDCNVPAGATITLKCGPTSDYDYDNETCSVVDDGATITWTAKDGAGNDVGTFTDNEGTTAVWIAPAAEGTVTIYATADDDPNYLADDAARQDSVVLTVEKIFRFVAWADNRPSLGGNVRANFQWVLREVNDLTCPNTALWDWPAFHVVPGDYDDTQETEADLGSRCLVTTWYRAPGNHDLNDIGATNYLANYTSNYQNARFIYLNEYICPGGVHDNAAGRVCSHILSWLHDQLTDAPTYVFVVGHEPAFPANRHVGTSLDVNVPERDAFWDLINSHNVYAYLCGHTHFYSTYSGTATIQIDLGNAGNPGEAEQTFVLFEVRDNRVTRRTYRGTRGQVFTGS